MLATVKGGTKAVFPAIAHRLDTGACYSGVRPLAEKCLGPARV